MHCVEDDTPKPSKERETFRCKHAHSLTRSFMVVYHNNRALHPELRRLLDHVELSAYHRALAIDRFIEEEVTIENLVEDFEPADFRLLRVPAGPFVKILREARQGTTISYSPQP